MYPLKLEQLIFLIYNQNIDIIKTICYGDTDDIQNSNYQYPLTYTTLYQKENQIKQLLRYIRTCPIYQDIYWGDLTTKDEIINEIDQLITSLQQQENTQNDIKYYIQLKNAYNTYMNQNNNTKEYAINQIIWKKLSQHPDDPNSFLQIFEDKHQKIVSKNINTSNKKIKEIKIQKQQSLKKEKNNIIK